MSYEPVIVKPSERSEPLILDKRTYAPYVLIGKCPKCGHEVDRDLSEQYLSYPTTDTPLDVTMYCCDDDETCGHEFKVRVVVRLVVEAAS